MRDRIVLRLVALREPLPLGKIQCDARCSTLALVGEVAILSIDRRNDRAQRTNDFE
jgi:hypothetical protein